MRYLSFDNPDTLRYIIRKVDSTFTDDIELDYSLLFRPQSNRISFTGGTFALIKILRGHFNSVHFSVSKIGTIYII